MTSWLSLTCVFIILWKTDIKVKQLDKRSSGQAFEIILSPTAEAIPEFPLSPKKDRSLEDLQKKMEAAENRRKVFKWAIELNGT